MKSMSEFFKQDLRAPLRNPLWSWGSETDSAVFLRVWTKDLQYKARQVCVMAGDWRYTVSPGLAERDAHIAAIEGGKAGYMIICEGHQEEPDGKMVIDSYRPDSLYRISSVFRDGQSVWAIFDGLIPVAEVASQ